MHARRQQHDVRIGVLARGHVAERREEVGGIGVDRAHAAGTEELWEDALHRRAVLEHVRDAGRTTAVVFEDEVAPVAVADQVGAADVDVSVLRDGHADEFRPVMRSAEDDLRRDHAVLDDALLVVDVVEEEVQRRDPLDEACLDMFPLIRRDDAGKRVEGEDALRPFLVAVDREGDALFQEEQFEAAEFLAEFFVPQAGEFVGDVAVVGTDLARGVDEFVEEVRPLIVGEDHAHK